MTKDNKTNPDTGTADLTRKNPDFSEKPIFDNAVFDTLKPPPPPGGVPDNKDDSNEPRK